MQSGRIVLSIHMRYTVKSVRSKHGRTSLSSFAPCGSFGGHRIFGFAHRPSGYAGREEEVILFSRIAVFYTNGDDRLRRRDQ